MFLPVEMDFRNWRRLKILIEGVGNLKSSLGRCVTVKGMVCTVVVWTMVILFIQNFELKKDQNFYLYLEND